MYSILLCECCGVTTEVIPNIIKHRIVIICVIIIITTAKNSTTIEDTITIYDEKIEIRDYTLDIEIVMSIHITKQ